MLLKDNRTNVNAATSSGTTPLHLAAAFASSEAVFMLLNHQKINVNMVNSQGIKKKNFVNKTPVDFATQNGLNDIILLLKKHNGVSGKELNSENNNNQN